MGSGRRVCQLGAALPEFSISVLPLSRLEQRHAFTTVFCSTFYVLFTGARRDLECSSLWKAPAMSLSRCEHGGTPTAGLSRYSTLTVLDPDSQELV